MKRIAAVFLATIIMLGSIGAVSFAAEGKNLCRYFNNTAGIFIGEFLGGDIDWTEESFYERIPVEYCFVEYLHYLLMKDGVTEEYTTYGPEGEYECRLPYEMVEAKANSIADYSGELKNFSYDAQTDEFVFCNNEFSSAMGHPAFVIGYNALGDDSYDVYIQRMQLGFSSIEELEAEFGYVSDKDKNIFIDYNGYYHLVHSDIFYRVRLTYDGESVFYNSVEKLTSIDGIEMITRDTSVEYDDENVGITAPDGVFPIGTQLYAQILEEGASFLVAQKAMLEISNKYTVYDISAKKDSIALQPDGSVTVTFKAPNGYNLSKLSVYYVSASGQLEKLNASVDKEAKTVTVILDHFSIYVLAEVEVLRGDLDGDGTVTVSDALAVLRVAAKLTEGSADEVAAGDIDGDGALSVADALAILRVAAKLADSL